MLPSLPKLFFTVACAAGLAQAQTASAPPLARLQAQAAPGQLTQVMVVGTFHFSELGKRFQPALVAPLLDRLAAFKPEVIAVEALGGPYIQELETRPHATKIHELLLDQFASVALALGHEAQQILKLDPIQATQALAALPPPGDAATQARRTLGFLAAYELSSALLAWSGVPPEAAAARGQLPAALAAKLDARLAQPNERVQLALPLARRMGLAELRSVDEFESPEELEGVMEDYERTAPGHAILAASGKASIYQESKARKEACLAQGDLLPLFRFLNAPATQEADVDAQWGRYLRSGLKDGSDRGRLAMWENRNLRIAARIRALSARHPGRRILVIFGGAHKPFLDAYLGQCSDLRVLQPEALLR